MCSQVTLFPPAHLLHTQINFKQLFATNNKQNPKSHESTHASFAGPTAKPIRERTRSFPNKPARSVAAPRNSAIARCSCAAAKKTELARNYGQPRAVAPLDPRPRAGERLPRAPGEIGLSLRDLGLIARSNWSARRLLSLPVPA